MQSRHWSAVGGNIPCPDASPRSVSDALGGLQKSALQDGAASQDLSQRESQMNDADSCLQVLPNQLHLSCATRV